MNIPAELRPDRRDWLPMLVFAFGLLVQTAGVVWWASGITERLEAQERVADAAKIERTALDARIDLMQQSLSQSSAYMARIEERLSAQMAALARVERLLEKQQ